MGMAARWPRTHAISWRDSGHMDHKPSLAEGEARTPELEEFRGLARMAAAGLGEA